MLKKNREKAPKKSKGKAKGSPNHAEQLRSSAVLAQVPRYPRAVRRHSLAASRRSSDEPIIVTDETPIQPKVLPQCHSFRITKRPQPMTNSYFCVYL